jgi:ribosomal protein L16 Arg81 hydroxylase
MGTLIKNFCSFEQPLDFNFISKLLNRNNFTSKLSSNWNLERVLESVFKIEDVQQDYFFYEIYNQLNNSYNKLNKKTNLYLFFSLIAGNKSIVHRDPYDVYILNLYGRTMYTIEDKDYILEIGDLIHIPKNELHIAISLTPRICLSFGIYE